MSGEDRILWLVISVFEGFDCILIGGGVCNKFIDGWTDVVDKSCEFVWRGGLREAFHKEVECPLPVAPGLQSIRRAWVDGQDCWPQVSIHRD